MKTTVGTQTEVLDRGVTPWTQMFLGKSVMYLNVVKVFFIIVHYITS